MPQPSDSWMALLLKETQTLGTMDGSTIEHLPPYGKRKEAAGESGASCLVLLWPCPGQTQSHTTFISIFRGRLMRCRCPYMHTPTLTHIQTQRQDYHGSSIGLHSALPLLSCPCLFVLFLPPGSFYQGTDPHHPCRGTQQKKNTASSATNLDITSSSSNGTLLHQGPCSKEGQEGW